VTRPADSIASLPPRDRRIVRHIRAIVEAGTDLTRFSRALQAMRDDPALSTGQREAIFKSLAQEAAQAYYVMATGEPIDLEALKPA
jgi:hypothetical protein